MSPASLSVACALLSTLGPFVARTQDEDALDTSVERIVYASDLVDGRPQSQTYRRLSPSGHFVHADLHPRDDLVTFCGWRRGENTFNVWVCKDDGSRLRRVTDDEFLAVHPAWVPRTDRIVYVSTRASDRKTRWEGGRRAHLWMTDRRGSFHEQLTFGDHSDLRPAVSPDGKRVVFLSNRSDERYSVWELSLEDGQTPTLRDLGVGSGMDARPILSPDGRWLVYGVRSDSVERPGPHLVWQSLATGETLGPLGTDDFAQMKGTAFLGSDRVLFHASEKVGDGFRFRTWKRGAESSESFAFDRKLRNGAHATVNRKGDLLVFDSYQELPGLPAPEVVERAAREDGAKEED